MPRVVLASGLARWLQPAGAGPSRELALDVDGATLVATLESLFTRHPVLRGYVLDEHGRVRHHVAVFIDGQSITDKCMDWEMTVEVLRGLDEDARARRSG